MRVPRFLRRRPSPKEQARMELLRRLPHKAKCVEVGVWRGDFSQMILRHTKPARLYLVDPWVHQPDKNDALYGMSSPEAMNLVRDHVYNRFRQQMAEGRVAIQPRFSTEAAQSFPASFLDWAYIDGDHTYDAVLADLQAWDRVVKPGGYLCGDDHIVSGTWGDDVIRAVQTYCESSGNELMWASEGQFLIQKRDPAAPDSAP